MISKQIALVPVILLAGSLAMAQGASTGGKSIAGGTASAMGGGSVSPSSLVVVPSGSPTQNVGQTLGLTATVTFTDGTTANVTALPGTKWTSSNLAIGSFVSLTATENIQCVSAGTVSFTATYGNISGSIAIICQGVLPPTPTPVSLAITPTNPSIPQGQTGGVQYTATETYSDNSTQNVTAKAVFTSSNTSVASIGPLTATREIDCPGTGTSTIGATNDGLSAPTTTQTCTAVLTGITVNPATPSILAGNTQQFLATCSYSDGSSQTCSPQGWSSSNTAIATINTAGLANGLAAGTTTIKSTLGSTSGTTTLTVTNPGPPPPTQTSTGIAPVNSTINVGTTLQYIATAMYSDGSSQPCPAATWASTSTGVATISSNGLATAVANGSTTIQGTCNSILGSTTLTVQTPAPTLSSIAVTPANQTQYNGSTVQFTATGTYSDGSTKNLTTQAAWTSGTPAVATIGASTGLATCVANSGTTVITATFNAVPGTTNLTCQPATTNTGGNAYCTPSNTWVGPTTDGVATLPTQCMYTPVSATPSPGAVRGPDSLTSTLQADINAAACGDTILVTSGSVIAPITWPNKGCDSAHWITIKSTGVSNVNFPSEGTRMTPCWSGVASLPGRPAYTCPSPQVLTFQILTPNASNGIKSNSGDHYRVIGAEITRVTTGGVAIYNLVDLSSSGIQTNNIIFDRVWFHGIETTFPSSSVGTDTSTTRAIYLGQSNHIAIIDSYFSDFYDTSSRSANGNTDAQCIGGGVGNIPNSGWGVYKWVNNHCEASGEGFLLGGSVGPALTPPGCTITVNCNLDVPTDIEARGNYFFKPPNWFNCGVTLGCPTGWPVMKNGFEMKLGARALFEGNVVENAPYGAQVGWCWTLAPKNQSGGSPLVGTAPTALTNDFTYRYNYCYNAGTGPGYYQSMDSGCTGCQAQGMNRISDHDNVINDAQIVFQCCAGDGWITTSVPDSTGAGLNKLQNVSIRHDTFVRSSRYSLAIGAGGANLIFNFTWQDNIISNGTFGVGSNPSLSGCSTTNSLVQILASCVTGSTVNHNAVFGVSSLPTWPAGNTAFANAGAIGFTNYGTGDSGFNPANYQLTTSSPLHNAGSDGKDTGADIVTLNKKISGVRQ